MEDVHPSCSLGPERRRHRMFVTRNTEYHFRDGVCVAVRDRKSGAFAPSHLALARRLGGAIRRSAGALVPTPEAPRPGDALYFGGGRELVTSVLTSIERPPKRLVAAYP